MLPTDSHDVIDELLHVFLLVELFLQLDVLSPQLHVLLLRLLQRGVTVPHRLEFAPEACELRLQLSRGS